MGGGGIIFALFYTHAAATENISKRTAASGMRWLYMLSGVVGGII